jgi:hypothetical protein
MMPAANSIEPLIAQFEKERGYGISRSAMLSEPVEERGAAALVSKETFPWKKIILWVILVGGVNLLGILAWRLYRQIG